MVDSLAALRERLVHAIYSGPITILPSEAEAAVCAIDAHRVDQETEQTRSDVELAEKLRGRALFLRDRGEIKSPELMERAAMAIDAPSPARPTMGDGVDKDAARYRWWRDHIEDVAEDGDGVRGVAFSMQLPIALDTNAGFADIADAVADAAIAAAPSAGRMGVE